MTGRDERSGNRSLARILRHDSIPAMNLSRTAIIERLIDPGIIVVIRVRSEEQAIPIGEALAAGGVVAVEVTMSTPGALSAIRRLAELLPPPAIVGVGTVLDAPTAQEAIEAGAQYVVTPILRPEIIPVVHAADKPIVMGVFSPTEAQTAHEAGSDFVKFFPSDQLGAEHIRAVRRPLPHLKIVPTGGVNLDSMESFFAAGCSALGVGSSILTPEILEREDWPALERNATAYVAKARELRQKLRT